MTADPPKTRQGILARFNQIAPYPEPGVHGQAFAVARRLTVSIQRRRTHLGVLGAADEGSTEYRFTLDAMTAEYAALHLLMELMAVSPVAAEQAAGLAREVLWDGGPVGEGLWMHAETLGGVDLNEVARLETAFRAAPEPPGREGAQ